MIKANELRIGNYVYDNDSRIIKVSSTGNKVITADENDATILHKLDNIIGIPLTPEILEQCGFKHLCLDQYDNKNYSFRIGGLFIRKYDKCILSTSIYFLHQFQNLYFALTNEELNFIP